jgi:hypothetical protein
VTERAFGSNFKWFVAKVVNRGDGKDAAEKDKTESGRVQIRIYGKHDDEKNIPDSTLPWAIPMLPINSGAGRAGVSASPLGLQKDSQVVGFFADSDENIPILMGILVRSGKDGGNDGETVTSENNDLPKGARTAATSGGDENDKNPGKSIINDIGQNNQQLIDKKTIGNIAFEPGTSALDYINKADPSNLSGSISGALSGMKSMTSTLNVASSLLSNFSGLMSGKLNLTSLLSIGAQAAGLKNYVPNIGAISGLSGSATAVARSIGNASSTANIAKNLLAGAFSGGNPLETVLGGLGGLGGLQSLAGKATGLLGPISGNFAAGSAIAGTMKGMTSAMFAGGGNVVKPIPFGAPNLNSVLGNVSAIAGITSGIPGIAASVLSNSPISASGLSSLLTTSLPVSLQNSSLTVPYSVSAASIISNIKLNPGINVSPDIAIPATILTKIVIPTVTPSVINDVTISSINYNINSLQNSSVNVNIPIQSITAINYTLNNTPGIAYKATGSVFTLNRGTTTKRI